MNKIRRFGFLVTIRNFRRTTVSKAKTVAIIALFFCAAAELLSKAVNPVIVSGGGVVMSDAVADVAALAERLQAPVCNTYLHNDSFPR